MEIKLCANTTHTRTSVDVGLKIKTPNSDFWQLLINACSAIAINKTQIIWASKIKRQQEHFQKMIRKLFESHCAWCLFECLLLILLAVYQLDRTRSILWFRWNSQPIGRHTSECNRSCWNCEFDTIQRALCQPISSDWQKLSAIICHINLSSF